MALILIISIFIIRRMYFLTNVTTMAYMFQIYKYTHTIKFHKIRLMNILIKQCRIRDQIFVVLRVSSFIVSEDIIL